MNLLPELLAQSFLLAEEREKRVKLSHKEFHYTLQPCFAAAQFFFKATELIRFLIQPESHC